MSLKRAQTDVTASEKLNLTIFGLLVAYGIDSGMVMASVVFVTIWILQPKWSSPKVIILSSAYCSGIALG